MKKIVCFGGGSGIPTLILEPLKDKYDITSVTSMVDNGGSTGALRKELGILPPGDIRRHILALSEAEEWKKKLWKLRFANDIVFDGGHRGHNFANVFIGGLEHITGDFEKALEIVHGFMEVKGRALPATIRQTQIVAELENGQIAFGEDEIDVPKEHDGSIPIKKVFLDPEVEAYPPTVKAVREADAVIIGPGDMYSSLVASLLPSGIREALQETEAKKIFVVPAMRKFGETNSYTVMDFARAMESYMGTELDYVVYNTAVPNEKRVLSYKVKEPLLLGMVSHSGVPGGEKYIGTELIAEEGDIKYTREKLMPILDRILKGG